MADRCPALIANDHDGFGFHLTPFGQRFYSYRGTGRERHIEKLFHHLVHDRKVIQLDQVQVQFDDIAKRPGGFFADRLQVGKYLNVPAFRNRPRRFP